MATQSIVKVSELLYPRLTVPDLDAMEAFLMDFGMVRAARDADTLYMRGTGAAAYVQVVHKGATGFAGFDFGVASARFMRFSLA